jgi:hypothetical protein
LTLDLDARLAEMPVIARRDDYLEAEVFNLWRRARNRLGSPIRLTDLGLKQIEVVLTDSYWVCVDAVQYDCPVLAWVGLDHGNRDSLHEPIRCTLNYYHFGASAVRLPVLLKIREVLQERLSNEN